jgi:hypothetical protein
VITSSLAACETPWAGRRGAVRRRSARTRVARVPSARIAMRSISASWLLIGLCEASVQPQTQQTGRWLCRGATRSVGSAVSKFAQ